jgi:membrane-associated phospholipid phosphatase
LETLITFDQQAFFFINQSLRNALFDFLMPYLRTPSFWIPVYVLLAAWVIYLFRWQSIIILLTTGLTVLLTDQIASSIIKPAVERLRPCNDPTIATQVHLLVDCGSGFSFVSSHASNHFGIAVFLILILGKRFRWVAPIVIFWATLISFAQVYVGLHYPMDMIAGAALGVLIGIITGRFCKTALRKSGMDIR